VLVVGFGNSGGEIALDAAGHGAKVTLAVRGPVQVVPREILGIPITTIAALQGWLPARWADALNAPVLRAAVGNLSGLGLQGTGAGPIRRLLEHRRVPVIDVGTIALIRDGSIQVRAGIDRFVERGVVFLDGSRGDFDTVVLATGYRPALEGMLDSAPGALDKDGMPRVSGGPCLPGLYFCGFHMAAGGMLREIGREARRIAAHIASGRACGPVPGRGRRARARPVEPTS
jgi:hypothetical protein